MFELEFLFFMLIMSRFLDKLLLLFTVVIDMFDREKVVEICVLGWLYCIYTCLSRKQFFLLMLDIKYFVKFMRRVS